jgi:hypothetical protein
MSKGKRRKGQTMFYKTLRRELMNEQHEPHKKLRANSSILEE